ncbi:MAG TPA: tetratricopeptide repeat protein [Phycisphaerales bacterium]|nr:tetratricopeptide repeat protein [Phycisphaerales bacterium]
MTTRRIRRLTTLLAVVGLSTLAACSGSGNRPLHAMRADGDRGFDVGDYATAADHYQQYVDVKPSDADIRYKLGRSYLELGRYADARQNLQVAYDLKPDTEEYIDAYAESLMRSGEKEQLFAFLTKVVNERGKASDYLRQGEYGMQIGNADDAVAALLTAAKLDGGVNARFQIALAKFYQQVGDNAKETERLRMAYFLAPNNAHVRERAAALGQVLGPTFALRPLETQYGPSAADTGQPSGTKR